ncbi:MAG: hypothetical protein WCR19_06690, partial [Acholeplasmataceae bacterium]
MALKNKPITSNEKLLDSRLYQNFTKILNDHNVSKHRKIVLKTNYLKGLIYEYEKKFDLYIQKETKLVEGYYQEDLQPLEHKLNLISHHDDKREALMKKFDKKHYWLRRKFKTSQLRKNDAEKVESLLKDWDQTVSQKREIYAQEINQKYPHTDLSQNTIQKTQDEIDKLNQRKEKQLEKMNAKGKKLQIRVDRFLKRNASKIEKLENKNNKLVSLILK